MATSRIATQPRVSRSLKSAKIAKNADPNDPAFAQARLFADTIQQLRRGIVPRELPKLPLSLDGATSPPERSKGPSKAGGRKPTRRQSGAASPPDLARHRRKCVICNHPDRDEIEEQFIHWRTPGRIAYDFDIEETRYIRRHAHAVGLYARRRENYLFTLENILERGDEFELTAAAYLKAVRAYACMCDTVRWNEPAIRVHQEHNVHTDRDEQIASSSALPKAAFPDNSLSAPEEDVVVSPSSLPKAASNQPVPAAHNNSHFQGTADAARIPGIEAGASAPKGSASAPLPPSSFEPPASRTNRPSPRLEIELTHRKQRKEVRSNRPQNAK